MATVIKTIGLLGLESYSIEVQVKIIAGPTTMNIVGLGDQAVKEAKDRVEAAFDQVDAVFPKKKIIVNLSPSDVKKSGTYFDLPMIIGLLLESDQLKPKDVNLEGLVFLGEVGLTGGLVSFKGIIPMIIEAKRIGYKGVIIPYDNLPEAEMIEGIELYAFHTLKEVLMWLEGRLNYIKPIRHEAVINRFESKLDFLDVKGHQHLLRYVVAAAAGAHNMLLIGPPGCGKSMIAKRIPTILPDLTEEEAMEVMAIQSISGKRVLEKGTRERPFRAPHYNSSSNALIGGGINALPGEISLAHNGVLFLDELTEFSKQTIESLRQPLEDRIVTVARVRQTNTFPSNFMLIAAMNPCKCGYHGDDKCTCSLHDLKVYRQKISGPIYDRMDIQKYLSKVDFLGKLADSERMSSSEMKSRVTLARRIQEERFKAHKRIRTNSQMDTKLAEQFCALDSECHSFLNNAYEKVRFSARSYNKILNLARTFADLDASETVRVRDLTSALLGRDLEKSYNTKLDF